MVNFSPSVEARFQALMPQNPLIPADLIRLHFSGAVNPETLKPDDKFGYIEAEQSALLDLAEHDAKRLNNQAPPKKPIWLTSAGGPGAGKTTTFLARIAALYGVDTNSLTAVDWAEPGLTKVMPTILAQVPAAWISPDRGGLFALTKYFEHAGVSDETFYKDWRAGTNFLSNGLLSQTYAAQKNILHDTTLSSPFAINNLVKAKEAGYYVAVFPIAAPLDTRAEATGARNSVFYQSLPANLTAQDQSFGNNFPAIFGAADEMSFNWRDRADEASHEVALVRNGELKVVEENGFAKFRALYPQAEESFAALRRVDHLESGLPELIGPERQERLSKPSGPASTL